MQGIERCSMMNKPILVKESFILKCQVSQNHPNPVSCQFDKKCPILSNLVNSQPQNWVDSNLTLTLSCREFKALYFFQQI